MIRSTFLAALLLCTACSSTFPMIRNVTPKSDGTLAVEVCSLDRDWAGMVTIDNCHTEKREAKP
jgi:hypothetical protein